MTDTEFQEHLERRSDVDGFTVVERTGRRPRIHLLRPWHECNATKSKSGKDTVRIRGSREVLNEKLGKLGYKRGGIPCRRCFRYASEKDVAQPVLEMGDPHVMETIDKYDGEQNALDKDVETLVG